MGKTGEKEEARRGDWETRRRGDWWIVECVDGDELKVHKVKNGGRRNGDKGTGRRRDKRTER